MLEERRAFWLITGLHGSENAAVKAPYTGYPTVLITGWVPRLIPPACQQSIWTFTILYSCPCFLSFPRNTWMTRDASAGSSPPSSSLPDIACLPRITELFKLKQGFGDCGPVCHSEVVCVDVSVQGLNLVKSEHLWRQIASIPGLLLGLWSPSRWNLFAMM